jgi:hypothetical protein
MTALPLRLAALALAAAALAGPCRAESSIASSASDSLSRSSASISDSITGSSHASSPDNRQARGDFKVIEMAAVDGKPDMVRLRLQPVAATATADDEIQLLLPREAAAHGRVADGTIVTALPRPYGIEFATGQPHAAFFLALADDWQQELKSAPLSL